MIAIAAAVAAMSLLVFALLLALRSRLDGERRMAQVVARVDDRLETMIRDLSAAVERAEEESRRARRHSALTTSIEVDDVVARTLEAAHALPNVHAATLSLDLGTTQPLVAGVGLGAEEIVPPVFAKPPDGSTPRAVSLAFAYEADADTAGRRTRIREGFVVPLVAEDEQIGALAAYSREGGRFSESFPDLEELALRAAPALENARRFREARQLADLDALTGLHNRRYFHDTLAREVARSRRYGRSVSLLVLDLDDFKSINDRIGHLAGDAVLAEAAARIASAVRSADVACRIGGDEFAVILPESTIADADQLYDRIARAVAAGAVAEAGQLRLSAGVTELRPEDDPTSVFRRADEALYEAKAAGKGTVVALAEQRGQNGPGDGDRVEAPPAPMERPA